MRRTRQFWVVGVLGVFMYIKYNCVSFTDYSNMKHLYFKAVIRL